MDHKPHRQIHIFWALLLIALGVFLFLNNMTILKSGTTLETIVKCWPLLLVVGGIEAFINRHGFLWPILLTGLGVIFLLSNFNIIQMSIWSAVSRLWPVLLIALGLNLLIGRTRGWLSAVLGIGLGLLLVAAVVLLAVRLPQTTSNMQTLDIPAANVQTVNGSIEMTAGSLQLSTMDGGNSLLQGQVELATHEQINKTFNAQPDAVYTVFSSGGNYMDVNDTGNYIWTLKMNASLPTALRIKSAAGSIEADLSKANLTQLDINMAAGKIMVAIPQSGSYQADIEGAVGEIIICIPDDLAVRINIDSAVTATNFEAGITQEGTATNLGETPPILTVKLPVGLVSFRHLANCQFAK